MNEMLEKAFRYFGVGLATYFVVATVLAAAMAVIQEAKIWKRKGVPSLSPLGCWKVFWFNIVWCTFSGFGCVGMVAKWILTLGMSDITKDGSRVENWCGKACIGFFIGNVSLAGMENFNNIVEGAIPAPVFIANHASQIDLGVVYYIEQRFKWIAKQSVIFIPGVGQLMYLSQHVFINRKTGKNKSSVSNLYQKSNDAVQAGIPMLLFPQGTRQIAEKLPFKSGAFVIAQTNKSRIVPISIEIPMDAWNSLYPLNLLWGGSVPTVKLTVHKSIPVTGEEDRDALKQKCMDQIYSVLPKIGASESPKDK